MTVKEDPRDRQRRDLARALKKPIQDRTWGLYVDPEVCTGCRACMVACRAENNTPPGVSYLVVLEEVSGAFPHTRRRFLPKPCQHCAQPTCVLVCPVSATWRTPDGIVVMDYMKCIGCRYCMTACPYASRSFDMGDAWSEGLPAEASYERRPSPDNSRAWKRAPLTSPIGNVRKCHLCSHRIRQGLLPSCVDVCPTGAIVFGDLRDPDSLVSVSKARNTTHRLKEDLGNDPMVWYRV